MGNITLKFDGMKNALSEIDSLLLYLKQSKNEIRGISNNEEYATEIAILLRSINDISIKVKQYGNWIDETIDKFKNTELLNEDVMLEKSQAAIKFGIESKTGAISRGASSFVSVGRAVPVNDGGGSKSSSKSSSSSKSGLSSLLDTAAKVVKSVVNAVMSLFSNSSKTASSSAKSSSRNNSSNYEEQNSENTPVPERNWQEEAEEKNKGFLASLMDKMKAFGSFVANITSSVASNKKVTNVVEGLSQAPSLLDIAEVAARERNPRADIDILKELSEDQLNGFIRGEHDLNYYKEQIYQEKMEELSAAMKSAGASAANAYSSFSKGMGEVFENVADALLMANNSIASFLGHATASVVGLFGGSKLKDTINNATNASSGTVKQTVARNWIEYSFKEYYTNNLTGKWLENNAASLFKSEGAGSGILSGLGRIAGILGLNALTGGTSASAVAGVAAYGEGSQSFWRKTIDSANGENWNTLVNGAKGTAYSFLHGLWESVQWLAGAKLAGKGVTSVLSDTLFNSLDTPFRATLDTLTGGTFAENFDKRGGWSSVVINGGIGFIGSMFGEIADRLKFSRNNVNQLQLYAEGNTELGADTNVETAIKNNLERVRVAFKEYAEKHPELGINLDDVDKSIHTNIYACTTDEEFSQIYKKACGGEAPVNCPAFCLFGKTVFKPRIVAAGDTNSIHIIAHEVIHTQGNVDYYIYFSAIDNKLPQYFTTEETRGFNEAITEKIALDMFGLEKGSSAYQSNVEIVRKLNAVFEKRGFSDVCERAYLCIDDVYNKKIEPILYKKIDEVLGSGTVNHMVKLMNVSDLDGLSRKIPIEERIEIAKKALQELELIVTALDDAWN